MKMTSSIPTRESKAGLVLAAVLAMTTLSAALQTSTPPAAAPKAPEFAQASVRWIIVSLPDRKLALFKNGKVLRVYRVAVGRALTPSPIGEFKIANRVSDPTYYHKGQVIPAGENNPVGSRWMGLSAKSYGIHGTNQPKSIGKAASTGCIRMGKEDLEELFMLVEVGDAVQIVADRDEQIAEIFGAPEEPDNIAQVEAEAGGGGQ
jgi:lipoprotein-anchoring transpeptidase ErfK/SrfK